MIFLNFILFYFICKQTKLKDNFNKTEIDKDKWFLVQGATIQNACTELVDGTALVFAGRGMRLAETVDLDLRDAT